MSNLFAGDSVVLQGEPLGIAILLDFLTGSSVPDLATIHRIKQSDVEALLRSTLLVHGYAAKTFEAC